MRKFTHIPTLSLLALLLTVCEKIDLAQSPGGQPDSSTSDVTSHTDSISWFIADDCTDTLYIPSIPTEPTIIDGHLIALVSGNKGLLLSACEWTSVPSAYHATTPDAAIQIALSYTEASLTRWRIPTELQARALRAIYPHLSSLILSATAPNDSSLVNLPTVPTDSSLGSITPLLTHDAKGKTVRYLCSQAERTFSFVPTASFLKAGATVKYHLRLVHPVILCPHYYLID